jgi:hypothetical protein
VHDIEKFVHPAFFFFFFSSKGPIDNPIQHSEITIPAKSKNMDTPRRTNSGAYQQQDHARQREKALDESTHYGNIDDLISVLCLPFVALCFA